MNLIKTVNNARLEGITFNRVYKNSTKVGKTDSNGEINLVKEIAILIKQC